MINGNTIHLGMIEFHFTTGDRFFTVTYQGKSKEGIHRTIITEYFGKDDTGIVRNYPDREVKSLDQATQLLIEFITT